MTKEKPRHLRWGLPEAPVPKHPYRDISINGVQLWGGHDIRIFRDHDGENDMDWMREFDHVRIESMLFDGAPIARNGVIQPDLGRPGNGLVFREQDAARYAA